MLKRILATTAVLACCALPLAAQAHEKMAGDEMTITAQVADLNCNTTNAASLGGLSWAPDPEHGRLLAFDRELRVVRQITNPRLATPMAVTPLGGTELLVTEHTGEGVVVDTMGDGRVVREWESPDVASLYAAGAGRVAATRSPYYVPQLSTPEPDSAPLIRMLDTLGRPIRRFRCDTPASGRARPGDRRDSGDPTPRCP